MGRNWKVTHASGDCTVSKRGVSGLGGRLSMGVVDAAGFVLSRRGEDETMATWTYFEDEGGVRRDGHAGERIIKLDAYIHKREFSVTCDRYDEENKG